MPFVAAAAVVFFAFIAWSTYRDHREAMASASLESRDYERVIAQYPRSQAALVARLEAGSRKMKEGDLNQAISLLEPVTQKRKVPPLLRIGALQNLALAYIKTGRFDQAVSQLDQAIQDPGNPAQDYSRLLLARVWEMKGDGDKAAALYKTLSEGTPAPQIQQEAKERLSWLQSQSQK